MKSNRIVLAIAALVFSAVSTAATVAERSPFAQGHWWNPARSGNGFEIFNAASQVAVVWYTFDQGGRPVWYTAQGDQSSLGTSAWPLMRHKWSGDRISQSTQVGSLKLRVLSQEAMAVDWQVGTASGTWPIEPLMFSGVVNEVDHSGSWYAPANGGWGVTVSEQGDVLGGAVFTYDAAGEPTWVAGFQRGDTRTVEYFSCTGACPSCPYTPTQTLSAGRLTFDFASGTQLALRQNLSIAIAPGVAMDRAQMIPLSRPASSRAADRQLARFDTADALKRYLDQAMRNMLPNSGIDFSPAPPSVAFSQTNLQESGVDEADVMKSDGRFIYTFATNAFGQRVSALRIAEVGDNGSTLTTRGIVPLTQSWTDASGISGLYLHGSSLVALSSTVAVGCGICFLAPQSWMSGTTRVEIASLANPALPVTRWTAEIDGHLLASRRIGDRLYVVSRFVPTIPGFAAGATSAAQLASNDQLLASTALEAMLPRVRVNGAAAATFLVPQSVYLPPQGRRAAMPDMVVVTAIDLATPGVTQALAVVGTADSVYVSSENLYLARPRYDYRSASGQLLTGDSTFPVTDLHRISLGAQGMNADASGSAEGLLINDGEDTSFRMSESAGRMRIVTASGSVWGANVKNRLTVLEPSTLAPGLLKTVAILPNAQRPEPLGKPGETVMSARFTGDRLYVTTFRRTDPLYVIDLASAADPRVAGSLSVPGFADYLHPLANGLLLGFGVDATDTGVPKGLQISLYDMRDASSPREMQRIALGGPGSGSALLTSHHAFSSLPRADGSLAIAIPARLSNMTASPATASGLMRFELQGAPSSARLVQQPMLVANTAAPSADPGILGGRSIIFPNAVVYIGNGQLWKMGDDNVTQGPL